MITADDEHISSHIHDPIQPDHSDRMDQVKNEARKEKDREMVGVLADESSHSSEYTCIITFLKNE